MWSRQHKKYYEQGRSGSGANRYMYDVSISNVWSQLQKLYYMPTVI